MAKRIQVKFGSWENLKYHYSVFNIHPIPLLFAPSLAGKLSPLKGEGLTSLPFRGKGILEAEQRVRVGMGLTFMT
jgi:hypothetical protein